MGDINKTIEVIFAGTDKISGTISGVSDKIGDFAGSVESATQPLADLADFIAKVDTVAAAMAVGGLALAINQAGKFGDSFAEISTLTDATGGSLDKFKDEILDYSRTSTASIDDINAAIYTAISAGTDYKDSLDVLTTAEKLSVAGKADLEATTKVLVSSLNAYGASTNEAANYSDALFKTVKTGQTTLPELANSLAQVSTTAANSGVSFDELMAAIAAVTATGAPTSQAITSIKAAISAIVKPSAEAAKEAAELGIKFDASALASKGLDGVLKDVYKSTGGATDQIVKLFGSTESLPAVMTLGADASGKFAATLTEFANKAGATATAYARMAENFGLTNQNLANNVRITFIELGAELLPAYSDIVQSLSEVFKGFGIAIDDDAFQPLFDAMNEAGSDLADFFEEIATSLPEALNQVDWTEFIRALQDLGVSIGAIFDDFNPSDPQDVAKAIQFVVDSLTSLIDVSRGMVDAAKPVITQILAWVDSFNNLDESTKRNTGEVAGWGKVVNTLAGFIQPVTGAISGLADAIGMLAGAQAIKGIGSLTAAGEAAGVLKGMGSIAVPVAISVIGGQLLADLVYDLFPGLEEMDKKAFKATVDLGGTAYDFLIGDAVSQVGDWGADIGGALGDAIKWAFGQSDPAGNMQDDFDAMNVEMQAYVDTTTDFDQVQRDFNSMNLEMQAYVDTQTDFDAVQNDWDAITQEIENSDIRMPDVETNFESVQNDWESINNEIESSDIRMPVDADTEPAKDKIKKLKSEGSSGSMSMGVDLGVSNPSVGNGVGPFGQQVSDEINAISDSEVDLDFDLSGLAELINQVKSGSREAREAVEAQTKMMQAAAAKTEAAARMMQQAAGQQELAAQIMLSSGESDNTIKIDAAGVEPEIEAFMFKILKKIQIRANESGSEFLLAAAS